MKRNRTKHCQKTDQLRLFLCLAVFLYHLGILPGGYLAVCAFFVLSGYLAIVSFNRHFSLKRYFLGRLKRIYLPLLAVVFLSIGVISLFPSISWINLKKETTSVLLGYNNYWQLKADEDYFVRNVSSPFTHLWYISILMQYEALLPFFYLLLKYCSRKISRIIPSALCLVLGAASFILFAVIAKERMMTAYYGTFTRSFSLFLGIILGFGRAYLPDLKERTSRILFYLELSALTVMFIMVDPSSKYFSIAMLMTSLICTCMIVHGEMISNRNDTLSLFLSFLSSYTYEIYLLQYPVIFLSDKLRIPTYLKILPIIIITLLLSYLVKEALSLKRKSILSLVLCVLLLCADGFGVYKYISAADHTAEMEQLQNWLEENQKLIEEKNKEYQENKNSRKDEWKILKEDLGCDEDNVRAMLKEAPVTGIGDSILIDIAEEIYERFPNGYFDGKISRDLYEGNKILEELKNTGDLNEIVILCLSTNGDYIEKRNERLMEIVEDREVFWVNAVGPDDPEFNDRFEQFAQAYPNLHIVDWVSASKGHPEYFYYDNIHVMEQGVTALTDIICDRIFEVYLDKYRKHKEDIREEMNDTLVFYGNDALTAAYPYLNEIFPDALYRSVVDPESLYQELEKGMSEESLEHKIVFIFDQQAQFTSNEYDRLIALCRDHEICICRIAAEDLRFDQDNVTMIDLYSRIRTNRDYVLADGIHLSESGCKALAEMLNESLKQH